MRRLMLVVPLVLVASCAQLIGGVIDGAANAAGRRVGESIIGPGGTSSGGGSVSGGGSSRGGVPAYNPMLAGFYTQFLFQMAFGAGGYDMSNVPFKPGEYAVWKTTNEGETDGPTIERAYLADDKDGRQWWRVRFTDVEKKETTTLEGLFTKDLTQLIRLRGMFPGDKEGKEMPVNEQSFYMAPQKLSAESIKGATKGVETVTVPAGTFQARHIVFGGAGGTSDWWIVDGVPGGLVKQTTRESDSATEAHAMVLTKSGKDAKTELGSY